MNQNQKTNNQISSDEMRLIRLFRCMDEGDKEDALVTAAKTVMKKFSVNPYTFKNREEEIKEELSSENVEEFDERLLAAWPGHWNNRTMVDLDHFGDLGAVLWNACDEGVCNAIMGSSKNDDHLAEYLAEEYIRAERDDYWNSVIFTEWEDAIEENEDVYDSLKSELQDDFVNFIRAWREQVLDTIEKQRYGVK